MQPYDWTDEESAWMNKLLQIIDAVEKAMSDRRDRLVATSATLTRDQVDGLYSLVEMHMALVSQRARFKSAPSASLAAHIASQMTGHAVLQDSFAGLHRSFLEAIQARPVREKPATKKQQTAAAS